MELVAAAVTLHYTPFPWRHDLWFIKQLSALLEALSNF